MFDPDTEPSPYRVAIYDRFLEALGAHDLAVAAMGVLDETLGPDSFTRSDSPFLTALDAARRPGAVAGGPDGRHLRLAGADPAAS